MLVVIRHSKVHRNMHEQMTKFQEVRLLLALIQYSGSDGNVELSDTEIDQVLASIESNYNRIYAMLYHLSDAGIIHFEEIGEDGFAPIVMCSVNSATYEYLRGLVESAEKDCLDLESRITDILTFNPAQLSTQVAETQANLDEVEKHISSNELLKPLQGPLSKIRYHFESVSVVSKSYEDVYKNIIRPVQEEGKSGVKTTIKWAVFSIIASTAISLTVSNWDKVVSLINGV